MAKITGVFKAFRSKYNLTFAVAVVFLMVNPMVFIDWEYQGFNETKDNVEEISNEQFIEPVDIPITTGLVGTDTAVPAPQPFYASVPNGSFEYPAGSTIIPLGNAQSEAQLRQCYKALFGRIYGSDDVEIVMSSFTYNSVEYPAGTLASMNEVGGQFNTTHTAEAFNITAGLAMHPKKIAVFKSDVKDNYGQNVTWEEGYFERIFRVYLWGDYFQRINETGIKKGELLNYDVLIIPSIKKGYENAVVKELGSQGKAKLRQFVRKGNFLYAQGGSGYIAEAALLVPNGTVLLNKRIEAVNNHADMEIVNSSSIMSMNWLSNKMYMLNDPVLNATDPNAVVARYSGNLTNSSLINTSAILQFDYKNGQVVLTNGHPSVNNNFYPIVFDALFMAMAEPPDIRATARQIYNDEVPADLIPAQEPNVTVEVEITYLNFWPVPSNKKINLTETITPAFWLDTGNVTPEPESIWYTAENETKISWEFKDGQGIKIFKFYVNTYDNTTKKGVVHICSGVARYEPIGYKGKTEIYHDAVTIRAALAARLNGDRDIELDGCYPLPSDGFYYDIALPLENKEETTAKNITIIDIVCLKSPIVDVDNQTRVPDAWNNTNNGTSKPVFAVNEIFYYYDKNGDPLYPMPNKVINTTYTYQFGNNGTNITLPAKKLIWYYPDIIAYDYQEPAIRYGIYTHEEQYRTVSFLSSPIKGSVILNASGGSVYTNLGIHPIPYHEYLSHAVIYIPKGDEIPRVDYKDIWNRNHTMELRTVFYDIVPFPPPEEHAVVTTTFEMTRDGERLKEFPIHHEVEINYKIKTWNGYGLYNATSYPWKMDLHKNETMIVQAIPRGVGYNIEYIKSLFNENTTLVKIENTSMHTILYFQQFIAGGHKEVIDVKANLSTYPEVHREGRMKINDGARFVYHQIAVGPSRYEVFDSHVQAVFGIGNDVTVDKRAAPVYIATFGDDVYQFVKLEDPYEPREFLEDPYIKSYGFGDMAATTYVGGRINDTIHHSKVDPGDRTLIRIEVDNNLGYDLNNVSLTPVAPEGFKVTPDNFTTQIPPIFFDFPFINRTDIWDAWKSVYYFWVEVDKSVVGGEVYQINFTFDSNCTNASYLPSDFEIPPALIGVKDESGHVEAIFGRAVNLTLGDSMPGIVKPKDVRIANAGEESDFELLLATGISHPGKYNRSIVRDDYELLRNASFQNKGGGTIDITLPKYATMLPWLDNNSDTKTLYVIIRTNVTVTTGGTYTVNDGPSVSYVNHFNETVNVSSGGEYIEAHGPAFNYFMSVSSIHSGGKLNNYLTRLENNTVLTKVGVYNYGDGIAESSTILVQFPSSSELDFSKLPSNAYSKGNIVYWTTGDIGPGADKEIDLTFFTTPPALADTDPNRGPPDPWMMIQFAKVKFIHGYLKKPVVVPASNPLYAPFFDYDMALNAISFSHPFAATNHEHMIYADVKSDWPFTDPISNVKVNFSIDGVFIGQKTITSLWPNTLEMCGISHTFTKEGTYKIKAEIVGPDLNEFYAVNNEKEVNLIVVDPVTLTSKPDYGTGTDSFTASLDNTTNFGDTHMLKVGRVSSSGGSGTGIGYTRSMIKIDMSGIPSHALILDAKLELYLYNSAGGTLPISAYRLQNGWSENSISWNDNLLYDSIEVDTCNVDSTTGYKIWDVTTAVKSWVASPTTNYGLIFKSDYETWLWSKEFYSSDTENGLKPKLVVYYAMLEYPPDISTTEVSIGDYKDKELRLEWKPVPYALYYDIYRSTSESGPFSKLGSTWSFALYGGNGSLDTFFYDDVDGGYPQPPAVITTDRANLPGTIRVQWNPPADPAASAAYYYRIKAVGVKNKESGYTDPLNGQLTPTIANYEIYNSTSVSGPWTKMLGETSDTYYLHTGLGQGKVMYYRIKSISSEDFPSSLSKIVWGRSNRAPSVSGPYISPTTAYTTDYLYAKYSYSDPDNDAESGSQIRWYRDGKLISWYNDKSFVYYWSTKKGEVWYFTIAPKDGIEYGSAVSSGVITIQNSPPKLTSVWVQPTSPKTKDSLRLNYKFNDADGDSETTTQIRWYKNGVHQPAYDGKKSLPSSAISKGEVWNTSIRSSDGSDFCNWINPSSRTILNTLPVASAVKIVPDNAKSTDSLTAVYTYSDDDKDPEKGTKVYWYKNSQLQSAYTDKTSIPASAVIKGDIWLFTVTPHDGEGAGAKVASASVKIGNTPPEATDLKLFPDSPRTTDELAVWYVYSDADSDAESGTVIKWYCNDQYMSELDNKIKVTADFTTRGDHWQYTVTPNDGFEFGISYYSETVTILNTVPEVIKAEIDPSEPALKDDLKVSYEYNDADGDEIDKFKIDWFCNSNIQEKLHNILEVPSSFTHAGEIWYYELQLSDGFELCEVCKSEEVLINTPPSVTYAFITPGEPTSSDKLELNYECSDTNPSDEETESVITWHCDGTVIDSLDNAMSVPEVMTNKGEHWFAVVIPCDGKDEGEMFPTPPVIIGNSPPTVMDVKIIPDVPTENDVLEAGYSYNDADSDPESGTEITWYRNNEQVEELRGSIKVTSSLLEPGDIWYYTVKPSDGEAFGVSVSSPTVTISGARVVIKNAWITPEEPATDSKLTTNVDLDDNADGISIIFEYKWYKNGAVQPNYNDKTYVASGATSKGEQWYFSIRVYDGIAWSEFVSSDIVVIKNTPPVVENVMILPTSPISTDGLKVDYSFTDADYDSEQDTEIRWFKNGEAVTELNDKTSVTSDMLSSGDEWYCTILLADGEEYGAKVTAATVKVNTLPIINDLILSPEEPGEDDKLTLDYSYYDADNDEEGSSAIHWYRNGDHIPALDGMKTFPVHYTTAGETWYAVVKPHDGSEYGTEYKSNGVTVLDVSEVSEGTDTKEKEQLNYNPFILLIIIVIILLVIIAFFLIRRSKLLRSTSKESMDQILSIEDAEMLGGRARTKEERGWIYDAELAETDKYYMAEALEVPEYLGEEYVFGLNEADPCRFCDGDMDGDMQRCVNCEK